MAKSLTEFVEEDGVCSLCSGSIPEKRSFKIKKEKKGDKDVYIVECSDPHPELQGPSTVILETDKKEYIQTTYGSL